MKGFLFRPRRPPSLLLPDKAPDTSPYRTGRRYDEHNVERTRDSRTGGSRPATPPGGSWVADFGDHLSRPQSRYSDQGDEHSFENPAYQETRSGNPYDDPEISTNPYLS